MGSERLSHMFTIKDPTYKDNSSSKHEKSSHQSMSHTPGTHPVSVSNGPKSSSSSSTTKIKHKLKINSKYQKLFKLYNRQLSYIKTTINAIESLSKSTNNNENKIVLSYKHRHDEINETVENLQKEPFEQDHTEFDKIKNDIEQLMNDLKSYKMNNNDSNSGNTLDLLVAFPLDVSDSDNDEDKLLFIFNYL